MEGIAKEFYGEVKRPMAGILKRWIKRQKVLAPIVRLARQLSWKFHGGAQKA
jgi:hypothetical protein